MLFLRVLSTTYPIDIYAREFMSLFLISADVIPELDLCPPCLKYSHLRRLSAALEENERAHKSS